MPKYKVKIEERQIGHVEVEAKNKEDAENKALSLDWDDFNKFVDSTVVEVLEE